MSICVDACRCFCAAAHLAFFLHSSHFASHSPLILLTLPDADRLSAQQTGWREWEQAVADCGRHDVCMDMKKREEEEKGKRVTEKERSKKQKQQRVATAAVAAHTRHSPVVVS